MVGLTSPAATPALPATPEASFTGAPDGARAPSLAYPGDSST